MSKGDAEDARRSLAESEILFHADRITGAFPRAIAQVQSQRWLAARGFTLPSVYASRARADASPPRSASTSRRRPSRALPRRVVDSKARAILVSD